MTARNPQIIFRRLLYNLFRQRFDLPCSDASVKDIIGEKEEMKFNVEFFRNEFCDGIVLPRAPSFKFLAGYLFSGRRALMQPGLLTVFPYTVHNGTSIEAVTRQMEQNSPRVALFCFKKTCKSSPRN